MTVALAKAIKGIDSIEVGDTNGAHSTLTKDGLTIKPASGNEVRLTGNGLDNGGHKLTNIAAGVSGNDAVNVDQLNVLKGNNKEAFDSLGKALGMTPNTAENGKTTFDKPIFESVKHGEGEQTSTSVMGAVKELTNAVNAGLGFTVDGVTINRQLGQNVAFAPMADGVNGASGKNVKLSADANKGTINVGFSDTPTFKKVILDNQSKDQAPVDNEAVSGGYLNTKLDELNKSVTGNANLKVAGNDAAPTSLKLSTQTLNFKNGKNTNVTVGNVDGDKLPVTVNLDADLKGITSIAGGDNGNGAKITLSKDGQNLVTLNDAKLTGLAAGNVVENSQDAVTGGQLNTALDSIKKLFGDDVKNENGSLTQKNPNNQGGIAGTGKNTISGAIGTKLADFTVEGDKGEEFKVNNKQPISLPLRARLIRLKRRPKKATFLM